MAIKQHARGFWCIGEDQARKTMSEAVSLLHSCKRPKRVRQENLTSAREQLAAIERLASAQLSAELEMSPDILVF